MNLWLPTTPDFELFHIYCHQKDYRLCFSLNGHFNWSFTRVNDFLEEEENSKLSTYAQFAYADEISHKEYFVISNKPLINDLVSRSGDLFPTEQPELLIPELPKVDYFLQAYGHFEEEELMEMEDQLNLIGLINAAQRANTGSLRSYLNLMH